MTIKYIENKLKELRVRWKAGNATQKHWIEMYAKLLKMDLERLKNAPDAQARPS